MWMGQAVTTFNLLPDPQTFSKDFLSLIRMGRNKGTKISDTILLNLDAFIFKLGLVDK